MTDRIGRARHPVDCMTCRSAPRRSTDFYQRYKDDPLIIDKWFALQAATPEAKTLDRVKALTAHPAFSMTNPNRVRCADRRLRAGQPDPVQPA